MIVLLYGQPGSGKTTLSRALADRYARRVLIDGDDFRRFTNNGDYSDAGRRLNIKAAHDVAAFIARRDRVLVIVALVSPFADLRADLKAAEPDVVPVRLVSTRPDREEFHVEHIENGPGDPILDTDHPLEGCLEKLARILHKARLGPGA
jgi:hypothetical protein